MSNLKNYYWRIAGFYFFYYAFVGLFSPYWSLYLKSINFSAIEIAILMSIQPVMRMVAPYLWGWLADHKGDRKQVVQVAATLSAACYLGVFATTGFWGLFLVLILMGFFWSASMPLVEATKWTAGCPLILRDAFKASETNARTSVRPEASRWSSTSHWGHVRGLL